MFDFELFIIDEEYFENLPTFEDKQDYIHQLIDLDELR